MSPNAHLLLHDLVGIFSALVIMVLGFFVILKDHRKTVNITLGFTFLGAIIALLANVIGVSVSNSELSRQILMWNVSIIFISVVNFHCVMALLNQEYQKRNLVRFIYAIGVIFGLIFLLFPDTFIGLSVPKMYFPNYYTPGTLHWAFNLIFKLLIPIYFISTITRATMRETDRVEKKRLMYFTISFLLAWGFGIIPTFLTYDIYFDPVWGMLFPIVFAVPFMYAIFRYELLNIRIVAKKAVVYAISVIGVGILIGFFDLSNQWLNAVYPGFPIWATPLILAMLIVGIGVVIWQQLRESEVLKYEFITTVTHKFRTPLTHIKWATENLRLAKTHEDRDEQLSYIEDANAKLVELTDLLANASETDDSIYKYHLTRDDLSAFMNEVADFSGDHAKAKRITIVKHIEPGVKALFDGTRLRFVAQTFIENAINYTPDGGAIWVKVAHMGEDIIVSVKDSGIGISKAELSMVSTKLYRGSKARVTDTEGLGIGLYISKGILLRHHGKMLIDSEGEGKGATFSFVLPAMS